MLGQYHTPPTSPETEETPVPVEVVENPIFAAVQSGDLDELRQFINYGASPRARDEHNRTILHYAARDGFRHIVEYLVTHHLVDINARDDQRLTPIMLATRNRHLAIAEYLTDALERQPRRAAFTAPTPQDDNRENALFTAVGEGNYEEARRLMVQVDITTTDVLSRTLLHWAVHSQRLALVNLFVDTAIDVDATDNSGRTALHWAAIRGNLPIVRRLVRAGVDVNIGDANDMTPLHLAASQNALEIVQEIISREDVDYEARNTDGRTALEVARSLEYFAIARTISEATYGISSTSSTYLPLANAHIANGYHQADDSEPEFDDVPDHDAQNSSFSMS